MEAAVVSSGAGVVIRLSGRFDGSGHKAFVGAVDTVVAVDAVHVLVDFSDVTYIDSTALGLLLTLRDQARSAGKAVTLVGAKGNVKKILEIANFAKIFGME